MKVFVHLTFHNIPKFEPTFFQIWKTFLGLFKGVLGRFFVKMCHFKLIYSGKEGINFSKDVTYLLLGSRVKSGFYDTFLYVQSEVYAAREKNGIYIPRDRYLHEESEKKVGLLP